MTLYPSVPTRFRPLAALALALLLLAAAAAPAAAEDLTIVSEVRVGKGSPTISKQYFSEKAMRSSDGRTDTIVEYSTGRMVVIDHEKKAYYETSFEEMSAQLEEVIEMVDSNPMIAQMLGGGEVSVEKGTGTREIAGYTCHPYAVTLGDSMDFEMCVAPDLETPARYYDSKKLPFAAMGPIGQRFDKMFEAMKDIDGMPLLTEMTVSVMGVKMDTRSEATEVSRGALPADAFDPPAGYKKKKSPYQK